VGCCGGGPVHPHGDEAGRCERGVAVPGPVDHVYTRNPELRERPAAQLRGCLRRGGFDDSPRQPHTVNTSQLKY